MLDILDNHKIMRNLEVVPNDSTMFPFVHGSDKTIVALIRPDMKHGPWIAGGAALAWYEGRPVGLSDIDVFCRNKKQAATLINLFKKYYIISIVVETENAITFRVTCVDPIVTNDNWIVQIITKNYYNSPQEILNNFDITVCQIVTDGHQYIMGNNTANHIKTRQLVFNRIQPDLIKRLVKYWAYGFIPSDELLNSLDDMDIWNISDHVDYDQLAP